MAKAYILHNPLSGDGKIGNDLSVFEVILDEELLFADVTESGMSECVRNVLQEDDYIILCGGDQLSFAVIHGCGRARAAILLSALRKGTFPKHEKHLTVLSGREITVTLNEPRTLQVDGETTPDVTSYRAVR